jgi:hypothetical protein
VRAVLAGHDDMGVVLLAGGRSKTLVFSPWVDDTVPDDGLFGLSAAFSFGFTA